MSKQNNHTAKAPPKLATRLLRWYCRPELVDEVEGDLYELFQLRVQEQGLRKAQVLYWLNVLMFLHPDYIRKRKYYPINHTAMFRNYFKISWRNMTQQKGYSFIKIGGLALGITIALLIGLWIQDELTYNHYHTNHAEVAAVMQNQTYQGEIETWSSQSYQLGLELRDNYSNYFKKVVMSAYTHDPILSYGEKVTSKSGYFMESGAPELLSLRMLAGTTEGLNEQNKILLSEHLPLTLSSVMIIQ